MFAAALEGLPGETGQLGIFDPSHIVQLRRNTTGYYTGYIQKRQPVGRFELRQAASKLNFLQDTIKHRSNQQ